MTQKAVAELLQVNEFSVMNWERNKLQPRGAATLHRIIGFLGYDPLPKGTSIPELLRAKRRVLGWGQRELAEHLGVDRCTVTDWEGGRVVLLRKHRELLSVFLGIDRNELDSTMRKRRNDSH